MFATCALDGRGIEELRRGIADFFASSELCFDIVLPYGDAGALSYLHENGTVAEEEYTGAGIRVSGKIPDKFAGRIRKYLPAPERED